MSKECFNCQQVGPVFVQVGAKRVAEGMTGDARFPAEAPFLFMDMPGEIKRINGFAGAVLFWKEPAGGSAAAQPVLGEDVQCMPGKDSITVRTVFAMSDMDTHAGAADIFITEMADFPDAEAGGIKKGCHSLLFEIGHRGNEGENFLSGRNIGKIFIKFPHGKLRGIPRLVKDIDGKKTEL